MESTKKSVSPTSPTTSAIADMSIPKRAVTRAFVQVVSRIMLMRLSERKNYTHTHVVAHVPNVYKRFTLQSTTRVCMCQARNCRQLVDFSNRKFATVVFLHEKIGRLDFEAVLPCCGQPRCITDCRRLVAEAKSRMHAHANETRRSAAPMSLYNF